MKLKKHLIIIILNIFFFSNTFADYHKKELDNLFNKLKNNNASINLEIEQKIWKIWSTHPRDDDLTKMLENGSELVKENKLLQSIDIFTTVINLDPNWAEAWNKRATVFY